MKACQFIAVLFLALALQSAVAQILPQGSDVNLYFPQVADGGGEWQTTFVFLNPDVSTPAIANLYLIGNDGSPLRIDFGSGASSLLTFTIPPRGSKTFRSTGTAPTVNVGWAVAETSIPVQATASYRQLAGGVPKLEVSVYPTLPTIKFSSPATRRLGMAIANRYDSGSITVNLDITDSDGRSLADTVQVTIPALGHKSFYVREQFPGIANFSGTLTISAADTTYLWDNKFVAMTISEDETGLWSGLPSGSYQWPISHWERIQSVYHNVVNSVIKNGYLTSSPELIVSSTSILNALASGGTTVMVTLGLSELISDSPSELAFAIAHELGHIYQQRNNGLLTYSTNREIDADVWGVIFALIAGYDPYGIAGVLGKLSMASGQAGLMTQWELETFDIHRSINSRMENIYEVLSLSCNSNLSAKEACEKYKKMVHPHFPSNAPLMVKRTK